MPTVLKTSTGIEITGFAKHGLHRIIQRDVKPIDILDALRNPIEIKSVKIDNIGRKSQRFIGNNAEFVINPSTGKIISVNPTSSQKARSILNKK